MQSYHGAMKLKIEQKKFLKQGDQVIIGVNWKKKL